MKERSMPAAAYSATMGLSPAVTLPLPHGKEFLVGSDQQLRQRRESHAEEQLSTYQNPAKDLPSTILFPTDLSYDGGTSVHSAVKLRYRRASFPPCRRYSTPCHRVRRCMNTHNASQEIDRQIRKAPSVGSPYQQIGKTSPDGSPILDEEGDTNFEPDHKSICLPDEVGDNNFEADTGSIDLIDEANVRKNLFLKSATRFEPPQLRR